MAEHEIQVSDINLGQMTKIILEETICVSGRETRVLCDRASDPGKYEAVVDISNKHSICIQKQYVIVKKYIQVRCIGTLL